VCAENQKVQLSEDTLADHLVTFFFGGFDTTSIALTYALYEVAQRPEVHTPALFNSRTVFAGFEHRVCAVPVCFST
jgi:cytochrome P450